MQIEAGKYYRNRAGEIKGPMKSIRSAEKYQTWIWQDQITNVYTCSGKWTIHQTEDYRDLIEEVPELSLNLVGYVDQYSNPSRISPTEIGELEMPVYAGPISQQTAVPTPKSFKRKTFYTVYAINSTGIQFANADAANRMLSEIALGNPDTEFVVMKAVAWAKVETAITTGEFGEDEG